MAVAYFAQLTSLPQVERVFGRLSLLTSTFISIVAVSVLGLSYINGLISTRLDRSRFVGFMMWAVMSLTTDTLHTYWRMAQFFDLLDTANMLGSQFVLFFWLCQYVDKPAIQVREWLIPVLREVSIKPFNREC